MISFKARRNGLDFNIFADDIEIGYLYENGNIYNFATSDKQLLQYIYIEPDLTINETLARVRLGYEVYVAHLRAEAEADHLTEKSWLRAAEYNAEAQADMGMPAY
jgi:hypothetical protein